eukprot:CAMPEP_0197569712 /NCGR_PEP_ID=MMETSP1320-20131121/39473_1 /TAXON_ID=91990 /ORGANISM="Bolidomonas sp., Strain RCC2347" /LENGTH=89 /DNA_ID=CAMNT_0043132095 /DNA_START=112 /DNA_END=377 /DNA_ORIENTATION=+
MRDVTILSSTPLVSIGGPVGASPSSSSTSQHHTLPILNWGKEFARIRSAAVESSKAISLSHEVCTINSFTKTLTLGTRVLHYIGHGASS